MPHSRAIHDQHQAPRPLAVIREQFARLAGHSVAGLPPGWEQTRAAELAERLLYPQVPANEVDAVWASLIQQARTRDEAAVLMCAGAALPMLHSITAVLCGHWLHRADTESMVILGFLEALGELDVNRPNVANRLRWATFHRTCPRVRERRAAPIPADLCPEGDDPALVTGEVLASPAGHPDLLLQQAVDEEVLTASEAELILHTRLEHQRLTRTAADTGLPYNTLAQRRYRAEQRLTAWLRAHITARASSTTVEMAALDELTTPGDHTDKQQSHERMSKKRPGAGVLPLHRPAPSADHTSHEEEPRCA
ncbi:sigma-70 family RNA polymerase sigma factor [Nocardia jiangxiensis]|uniref:sigma-70 family RNA polymerase sigma factor n=1 Tax=Nocardia jiangxiensis TaxID=282685 RepID=UPI00030B6805|nr:sigma-70 family RNA polymerase sigma factor [Nocardia jiangxiensis]